MQEAREVIKLALHGRFSVRADEVLQHRRNWSEGIKKKLGVYICVFFCVILLNGGC